MPYLRLGPGVYQFSETLDFRRPGWKKQVRAAIAAQKQALLSAEALIECPGRDVSTHDNTALAAS